MSNAPNVSTDRTQRLLEVIKAQSEIAKLGLDLGAVMSHVTQRVLDLTPATGAVVELAEGDELVYRATSGVAEPHLGLRLLRANSLSGLCISRGQMLTCVDSDTDPRVDKEACRLVGLRSMIVVPLRHDAQVVGVLKVYSSVPRKFDKTDEEILGLMSDLIASAMFNAAQNESGALFYRATHDALTGLANRALFFDRLRHTLSNARRDHRSFTLLSLDMDGLKPINDTLGHRAGDAALCEIAERITKNSRQSDTVARVGGDEFGVILARCAGPEDAEAHAWRIDESLRAPFDFESHPVPLAASIGTASYPEHGEDIIQLMDVADQSMYAAKRRRSSDVLGT